MDDFNVESIVMLPLFLNESSKVQTDWLILPLNSMNSHIRPRQTQAMSVKGKKTIQMVDDGLLIRTIHEPQNPSLIYCIDLYSQHPKKPWSGGPLNPAMASSCKSWVLIVDLQVGNGHGTLRKLRGGLNSAMVASMVSWMRIDRKMPTKKVGEPCRFGSAKHLVSVDDLTPKPSTEAMHRFYGISELLRV